MGRPVWIDTPADPQGPQHAEDQPVHVEERQPVHQHVLRGPRPGLGQHVEVGGDGCGAQHDPLGRAGGAAGVEDHGRAVRARPRPDAGGRSRLEATRLPVPGRPRWAPAAPGFVPAAARRTGAAESGRMWVRSRGPASGGDGDHRHPRGQAAEHRHHGLEAGRGLDRDRRQAADRGRPRRPLRPPGPPRSSDRPATVTAAGWSLTGPAPHEERERDPRLRAR